MTVTILVPVYGVEKYIAQCAESLFQQTYKEIEYIFCNDCTPDHSIEVLQEVIERYPERKAHVRIISNERNKGLGGTRAHLISELDSPFFFIVDSDDILPLDAVEIVVKKMQETGADIVEGAYREYRNNTLGEPVLPSHDAPARYFNKALCQNIFPLRVWGKLYKAELLQQIPAPFFEGIDFAEDVCLTSRMVAVAKRVWTDDVVYHYRMDNDSSYTNNISEKNILSYFRAMKEVLRFYRMRGHLPLSLEIGVLNTYRECRKSGVSLQKADDILQYYPEHPAAKFLFSLFHKPSIPLLFSDFFYRMCRRLVTSSML